MVILVFENFLKEIYNKIYNTFQIVILKHQFEKIIIVNYLNSITTSLLAELDQESPNFNQRESLYISVSNRGSTLPGGGGVKTFVHIIRIFNVNKI